MHLNQLTQPQKKMISYGVLALFLLVIPFNIILLQQQNDVRSRASQDESFALTSPIQNGTIKSTVTLAANVNVPIGHHGVKFVVDGVSVGSDDTAPYMIQWDSTTIKDGTHTIVVKEINEEKPDAERSSAPITVTVSNDPNDKTAAAVTAVKEDLVQDNFATIAWDTNDKTSSQVIYKQVGGTDKYTSVNTVLTDDHSVALSNLQPSTEYVYQVKSTDAAGNTTLSEEQSFVTAADSNATIGQWQKVSGWNFPTVHASLLYTGELMLWSWNPSNAVDGTQLWNYQTNQFTKVGISNNIFCAGQAFLPDGRLIVAGGHINNSVGTKNINIYDPATKTWSAGPMMRDGRWYPTVNVLPNGKTIILTGDITTSKMAVNPEIYDYKTGSLSLVNTIQTNTLAAYSATFPFETNKLFTISYGNADMYIMDADAKTWTYKGKALNTGGATAQYRPGKILMTGGRAGSGADKKAAIIDINSGNFTWKTVAPMQYGRYFHNLVNLPDGKVLAVGGGSNSDTSGTSGPLANEIWDPATEQWTTVAPLSVKRMYHSTAILLPDGRVVASGGRNGNGENYDAEIYSPPYLFKGNRPTISQAPSSINRGSTITITTPEASSIGQVNLLSLAAQTHTHDMSQRFVPLSFTKTAGGLQAQIPSDIAVLPDGYFMLFIVTNDGVPSVAKMMKVTNQVVPTPTTPATPKPTATKAPTPTSTKTATPTPTKKVTPTPTRSAYPTLTSTPVPTKKPTATIAPTLPPSPTPTRIPVVRPTLQPTPTINPSATNLALSIGLHGIGRGGEKLSATASGNLDPFRKQRVFTVVVRNLDNQQVASASAMLTYNDQLGTYQGYIPVTNLTSGQYTFVLRTANYLGQSIPGVKQITQQQANALSSISLVAGDANNDNKVSVLDYNVLMDCFSDLTPPKACTVDKRNATDLNDDGYVNQVDYNFFLRELSVFEGN